MSAGADSGRDDDALAAEYALGVLPHAERADFAVRLEIEPALRARVGFWETHFFELSGEIATEAPPASVFRAIERRLFPDPEQARSGLWTSLAFWRGLGLAALAGLALLTLTLGDAFRAPPDAPQPGYVAEVSGEAGAVRLVALYDAGTGELRFNRTEGTPESGRDFELWLIAGDEAPISLGLLPADATGTLPVSPELGARFSNAILAITDEPAGGSPSGNPSGAPVATGTLTSI